jgi:hypothetical protein
MDRLTPPIEQVHFIDPIPHPQLSRPIGKPSSHFVRMKKSIL